MDLESEDETDKTFTTLTNVEHESVPNYQLQFEQFVVAEKSDSESDEDEDEPESDEDEIEEVDEGTNVKELLEALDTNIANSEECTLKSDEIAIIESCHHDELKNLLYMNRSKNFMLMQLFKKVKDLLLECRNDIESLKRLANESESSDKSLFFTHLGAPYFKTKKEMFSPSSNADTLTKKRSGELSIYQNRMTPKWSRSECNNLISAVKINYNHNKQKAILKKITPLKYKMEREKSCSKAALKIHDEINNLETEIEVLKETGDTDLPEIGKDDYIDWDHISSEYLMEKHSPTECRAFWHIYLHPSINKLNWSTQENEEIKSLALKYKHQDWDQIAALLGTNRSGFSICLHYVSALGDHFSKMKFTKEEDSLIMDYVERMRVGSFIPWNVIESYFPNRSRFQLIYRYKYYLNVSKYHAGKFTDAEDILILILLDRFGNNYSKFPQYMPHRSYMQIKGRYGVALKLSSIKGGFTLEEDQTIMKYITSPRFKSLGGLSHLMNRTRNQIRQRYRTLMAFLNKHPNATLKEAPRKNVHTRKQLRRYDFLQCIADQFKHHADVPTIEEIEEKLGLKKDFKGKDKKQESYNVDALLTNFFSSSYKLKQKPLRVTTLKINEAAETIFDILSKWKVNLDIPEEVQKGGNLDVVDLEILNLLRNKYNNQPQPEPDADTAVDVLLPPNMNSLIGLRGLLLKNHLYKRSKNKPKATLLDELPSLRNSSDNSLSAKLFDILKEMNPHSRTQVENERCLFFERFISAFMWPSIFSIEPPSELLLDSELGIKTNTEETKEIDKDIQTPNKSKYKTKRKINQDNVESEKAKPKRAKTIKIETATSNELTEAATLKPTRFSTRLKNSKKQLENNVKKTAKQPDNLKTLKEFKGARIIKILKKNDAETTNPTTSSNVEESLKTTKIIKIIKVNQKCETTEINTENNEEKIKEVPTNLQRVDSKEIKRMLNDKKPMKIFKIQKIRMKDGTIKNIAKPYEGNEITLLPQSSQSRIKQIKNKQVKVGLNTQKNSKVKITQPKLSTENMNILDMVSMADSVKQNKSNYEFSKINESNDNIDVKKLKNVLHNNIKSYSRIKKSEESKNIEDLSKLNQFLDNVEEDDDIIDLTKEEMKNDVRLLSDFIKSENLL